MPAIFLSILRLRAADNIVGTRARKRITKTPVMMRSTSIVIEVRTTTEVEGFRTLPKREIDINEMVCVILNGQTQFHVALKIC